MNFELFGVILDIRNQKWDFEGRISLMSEMIYFAISFSGSARTFTHFSTHFTDTRFVRRKVRLLVDTREPRNIRPAISS
jgi:hypothetical protein